MVGQFAVQLNACDGPPFGPGFVTMMSPGRLAQTLPCALILLKELFEPASSSLNLTFLGATPPIVTVASLLDIASDDIEPERSSGVTSQVAVCDDSEVKRRRLASTTRRTRRVAGEGDGVALLVAQRTSSGRARRQTRQVPARSSWPGHKDPERPRPCPRPEVEERVDQVRVQDHKARRVDDPPRPLLYRKH